METLPLIEIFVKGTLYHLIYISCVQRVYIVLFSKLRIMVHFWVSLFVVLAQRFHTYFLQMTVCSSVEPTSKTAIL